jgi:hypothetical protein
MSLPSRKERRNKQRVKSKSFITISLILMLNFLLFILGNNSLLLFIFPLSLALISYLLFQEKRRLMLFNLFLLITAYLFYLEYSFQLWAQK